MVSEVVLPPESFPADVTRVRSLISMSSLMNQQIVGLGELAVAVFANKLLLRSCSRDAWCSHWWRVSSWHSLCHDARVSQWMMVESSVSYPLVDEHGVVRGRRWERCDLSLHVGRHRVRVVLHCDLLVRVWGLHGGSGVRVGLCSWRPRLVPRDYDRWGRVVGGRVWRRRQRGWRPLELD